MATILDGIKLYCNVDDTDVYDTELLQLANNGIADLSNNGVPLTALIDATTDSIQLTDPTTGTTSTMDSITLQLVQSWLNVYCFRFFDKQVLQANKASVDWLDAFQTELLWKLKAKFDNYIPPLAKDWGLWYEIW